MIVNPRIGMAVRIHYRAAVAPFMPHQGKAGTVAIHSKGRPRNHGVVIDGVLVVVPCGNINHGLPVRRPDCPRPEERP